MKNDNNKLIFAAFVVMILTMILSSCKGASAAGSAENVPLETIVQELCHDVDVPPYETIRLDQSNFEAYAFIPYDETLSAAAADAMVNITPHSMVVIHTPDGNGAELAEKIFRSADPNKWLCVGSETVITAYTDHYVVLIMSYDDVAGAIADNFRSLAKKLDGMEMTLLSAANSRYEQ